MSKSPALRFRWQARFGSTAAALLLCAFGLTSPASAGTVTLCPSQAGIGSIGGIGQSSSYVPGPLDSTCGANSAVQINIPTSSDYGRLAFSSSTPGYPAGLTLGGLAGASANVSFSGGAGDQPYYILVFTDSSDSLGQAAATDQIIMLEFQSAALVGTTLALDPASTLFNVYDNTTDAYLQGGQQNAHSLDYWLGLKPFLAGESLDQIRIAEGLAGGSGPAESMTVNSLSVTTVPEPLTLLLFGAGIVGLGAFCRRKKAA